MGLSHSPSLVLPGLTLCLDAANTKSILSAVEVLVVAGGGGGGSDMGGGGGGGGVLYSSAVSITPGSAITATVGAGGAGAQAKMGHWLGAGEERAAGRQKSRQRQGCIPDPRGLGGRFPLAEGWQNSARHRVRLRQRRGGAGILRGGRAGERDGSDHKADGDVRACFGHFGSLGNRVQLEVKS